MYRTIVTLFLFVWIFCQSRAYNEQLHSCTAWGDPHVTRFPLNSSDYPQEVWCQESGLITLLKNKYVHASIWVSENPYIITEFNFVFFNDAGIPICVANGNQFLSPPVQCGQDITITKNRNFIAIEYTKFDIIVYLSKVNWYYRNWTYFYSIWVFQSSCLIKMSDGLCKTSCDSNSCNALGRRRRALQDNGLNASQNSIQQSAASICQRFFSILGFNFNSTSLQQMTIDTQNAYSACLTDVQNSGDLTFGKASVEVLAVNSVTKNLSSANDLQQILNQTIALINRTNTQLDTLILQFINSTALSPINYTVVYSESTDTSISCVQSSTGVIKIVSALYQSRSSSCSMDATSRVQQLCATSTRLCQFTVSNAVLQNDPCYLEAKQLQIVYQCQ